MISSNAGLFNGLARSPSMGQATCRELQGSRVNHASIVVDRIVPHPFGLELERTNLVRSFSALEYDRIRWNAQECAQILSTAIYHGSLCTISAFKCV